MHFKHTSLKISPLLSQCQIEEITLLPEFEGIDMYEAFDKNWNPVHLPGKMPAPKWEKDANGNRVFGYRMTLPPKWQSEIIENYKKIKGELAKPENINRKAVVDMKMQERLYEALSIAWDKGYFGEEAKKQIGTISKEEFLATMAAGGLFGAIATTEVGALVMTPVGQVLGVAYLNKKILEFDKVGDLAAKAVDRRGLDEAAKEMGRYVGL